VLKHTIGLLLEKDQETMNAITQVCYNSTPRHINSVKVAPILSNGKLGAESTATRQTVIDAIKRNEVYYTYPNGKQAQKLRLFQWEIITICVQIATVQKRIIWAIYPDLTAKSGL
jgi:hypothetical protein